MWGETCCWAAELLDPALVSVVYIAVEIPWVQQLSQYSEGQRDYPSQIYSHLVVPHLVLYSVLGLLPLYGPWSHVPPYVLVVILWACCFAVLADRWQVILGEFPGKCT